MSYRARLLAIALPLAVAVAPVALDAQTFDIREGFSLASNPAGPWSFGFRQTASAAFTSYTVNGTGSSGIQFWTRVGSSGNAPGVYRNGNTTFDNGGIQYLPGEVAFHPGASGELSVLRFTAPTAGSYALTSSFYGIDRRPTSTDVSVQLNGTSLFSALINGFRAADLEVFNSLLTLAAGDVLDFQVGRGSNNDFTFDSTGLEARLVVQNQAVVPEPGTVLLLGTGLLAVAGVARRRRA